MLTRTALKILNSRYAAVLRHCQFVIMAAMFYPSFVNAAEYYGHLTTGGYGSGGAIYNDQDTISFDDGATFEYNEAYGEYDDEYDGYGGAIYNNGSLTAENVEFYGNTATRYGGAVYLPYSNVTFVARNSVFYNNSAGDRGGAILTYGHGDSATTLEHVTISGNSAVNYGGGIDVWYQYGTLSFTNSIITDNYAGAADPGRGNVNVQNGGGVPYANNGSLIGVNPCFVTPPIWASTTLTNGLIAVTFENVAHYSYDGYASSKLFSDQ